MPSVLALLSMLDISIPYHLSLTWVLMLFHNIIDDWSIASCALKSGVLLEDFSWTQVRQTWSGSDPNWSPLTSNYLRWASTMFCRPQTDWFHPLPWWRHPLWAVDVPAIRQIIINLLIAHPLPLPVLAFILSHIDFCNVILAGFPACTSSACTECCRMVRRWSAGTCSHHRHHANITILTHRICYKLC